MSNRWGKAAGMSKQECERNEQHILSLIPTLVSDHGTKAVYALKQLLVILCKWKKSILHHHIKHEASSKLAYSHTQHHITHAFQILQKHLQSAWQAKTKNSFFCVFFPLHVLPEDNPHKIWFQTYVTLFAETCQSSGTIYTSKVCRVEGENHRAVITSECNPKSSVHMHTQTPFKLESVLFSL